MNTKRVTSWGFFPEHILQDVCMKVLRAIKRTTFSRLHHSRLEGVGTAKHSVIYKIDAREPICTVYVWPTFQEEHTRQYHVIISMVRYGHIETVIDSADDLSEDMIDELIQSTKKK